MLLNCGVGKDSWESLGLQGDPTSHPKENQFWMFFVRTDVEVETLILWWPKVKNWLLGKDPNAREDWRWKEKEMDGRGWDGWMASVTWWTWVWASSRSWWWSGKPGILQYMEFWRVGRGLVTELNWEKYKTLFLMDLKWSPSSVVFDH